MEESPPPVPRKDTPKESATQRAMETAVTASGSKRKREAQDETIYDLHNGRLEVVDPDAHTPKRSRSNVRQNDGDTSDSTPVQRRNLRRKKGISNLSSANLRHAAEEQRQLQARESRFQEGSLSDRPSEKPPSAFTRIIRTDSGNIQHVDDLMEDYHDEQDGVAIPGETAEAAIEKEKAELPQRVAEIHQQQQAAKEQSSGFFRFGKSFAASFHPVQLWNKLWQETKDELTQKNLEEAERKKRQKAEAEAKYAAMKQSGGFAPQHVQRASGDTATPRDSGIVMGSATTSMDHQRSTSYRSHLAPPAMTNGSISRLESEALEAETATKTSKGGTIKSRLGHFKKPSLSNIRADLKRVKSDFNLAAHAGRESSSSVSPVKTDFESSTLRKSHSKIDLKRQHKLSKRVSDLEAKLNVARRELGDALTEASPMPKLGSKYERFTPVSSIKRPRLPKFVPGRLPTLPSERLLDPAMLGFGQDEEEEEDHDKADKPTDGGAKLESLFEPRETAAVTDSDQELNEDTMKARAPRPYPPRASSLFQETNEAQVTAGDEGDNITLAQPRATSEPTDLTTDQTTMDPNSINNLTSDGQITTADPPATYASLDAKLKALDNNVKAARKPGRPKKRKSGADDDLSEWKPPKAAKEDTDWDEADEAPKKKRKAGRPKKDTQSSPPSKKTSNGKAAKPAASSPPRNTKSTIKQAATGDETESAKMANGDHVEDDVDELAAPARTSLDSQGQSLEPLYEEEEETTIVSLNDVPSKPTSKATPAHFGRYAVRSRSTSPAKQGGSVQLGVEETMITRAATAAKNGRRGRSLSPPPVSKTIEIIEESVSVVPGKEGVPSLPKGANGSFESLARLQSQSGADVEIVTRTEKKTEVRAKGSFEWPEDVF